MLQSNYLSLQPKNTVRSVPKFTKPTEHLILLLQGLPAVMNHGKRRAPASAPSHTGWSSVGGGRARRGRPRGMVQLNAFHISQLPSHDIEIVWWLGVWSHSLDTDYSISDPVSSIRPSATVHNGPSGMQPRCRDLLGKGVSGRNVSGDLYAIWHYWSLTVIVAHKARMG